MVKKIRVNTNKKWNFIKNEIVQLVLTLKKEQNEKKMLKQS